MFANLNLQVTMTVPYLSNKNSGEEVIRKFSQYIGYYYLIHIALENVIKFF